MAATNTSASSTSLASTLTSAASSNPTVQQSVASQKQTAAAGQAATSNTPQGTGIFNWQLPNIVPSLDQFLGLPTVIDWQDIGIRVSMVIVGIVILLLVAWSFVRGKQTTVVNVQQPPVRPSEEATEAIA